jgi:predicted Zn-dependent protease
MRSVVLILFVAATAAACATNPATGQRQFSLMSEQQEIAIGQQQDAEVRRQMGVYDDRALQAYVSDIGLRLARGSERPNLPWQFTIVDVPAINAFALPGGYIYVTRGLLPYLSDEAELAGVLGHEIGHVTARHAAQQYSKSTGAELGVLLGSIFVPEVRPFGGLAETGLGILMLKYSRDDELQADGLGVRYASRAGWDPAALPRMLTTLGRIDAASDDKGVPNWLATHPAPENRVERVAAAVQDAAPATSSQPVTNREEYTRRIDGIVFGDNPDQGVVRGSTFLHRRLLFAIDFPPDWDVSNGQTQVVAKRPGVNAYVVLQPVSRPVGSTIENVALLSMERAGFRAVEGRRETINGLEAFVGAYQGTIQDLGRVRLRAAHIVHDRHVYFAAGVAPIDIFDRMDPAFWQSLRTFRPLTRAEAENIRPNRVNLYTVRPGDTWQSIAEREGGGLVKASTLAIMNGHAVTDQPRPGQRLKIVVAG